MTSILELYDNLDLYGANFHLDWLNGYYANARMSKVQLQGGSKKIKPIGYVDDKAINIDTYDEAISCGLYQSAILDWLDAIRSSDKLRYLLEGIDYGPIGINKYPSTDVYFHYAVVLYRSRTDWMQTSMVLDPWYCQRATVYSIEEYKKWLLHFVVEPDNGDSAGRYPLTGGSGYSNAPKSKPKQLDLKDKTQVLVHCPVDVLVTDYQGNSLGVFPNGTFVEGIPSAIADAHPEEDGTLFWYFILPSENRYQVEITGKDNGRFNLQVRHGEDPLQDYGDQLISKGEKVHITIDPNALNSPLMLADGKEVTPISILAGIPT